jgi:hypothetical protein
MGLVLRGPIYLQSFPYYACYAGGGGEPVERWLPEVWFITTIEPVITLPKLLCRRGIYPRSSNNP